MNFALVGEKFTTKLVYHLVSFSHQPMNFSMKFFVCSFVCLLFVCLFNMQHAI